MPAREEKDLETQPTFCLLADSVDKAKQKFSWNVFSLLFYRKNVHLNKINIQLINTTSPYWFEDIKYIKKLFPFSFPAMSFIQEIQIKTSTLHNFLMLQRHYNVMALFRQAKITFYMSSSCHTSFSSPLSPIKDNLSILLQRTRFETSRNDS